MTQFAKQAWIRNRDMQPGRPARGRISCPCGNAPESEFNDTQPNIVCACGVVYSWDGWVLSRPEGATR